MDFENILIEAQAAATAAILAKFLSGDKEQPFNCGFAWVILSGRDPLAAYCRKRVKALGGENLLSLNEHRRYGSKAYPSGWQFWKPGIWPSSQEVGQTVYGQDMDFHYAGAEAFQKKLAEYGIAATVETRLD
jgi:hypothetical protein